MLSAEASKMREKLLGVVGTSYPDAGIEHFGGVTIERLERLIEYGFLLVRDKEVYSKFLRFMKKYSFFRAYGFVVEPTRTDSRIVIEGIESAVALGERMPQDIVSDFTKTFNDADGISINVNCIKCKYK